MLLHLQDGKKKRSFCEDASGKSHIDIQRTSTFMCLPHRGNEHIRAIAGRAADMLGFDSDYIEPMQLVNYVEGQHFGLHHDGGELDELTLTVKPAWPRRVATVFVYLTSHDSVGSTVFPYLSSENCDTPLSVQPIARSALIFSNIHADGTPDHRTAHCAQVVPKPHCKMGINLWVGDGGSL